MSTAGLAPHGAGGDARRRLHALVEISRLVSESLEPDSVMTAAAEATARLLDVENVSLWVHDPEAEVLRLGAQASGARLPLDATISVEASVGGAVLQAGQPL